jgi:hypothetical protein
VIHGWSQNGCGKVYSYGTRKQLSFITVFRADVHADTRIQVETSAFCCAAQPIQLPVQSSTAGSDTANPPATGAIGIWKNVAGRATTNEEKS